MTAAMVEGVGYNVNVQTTQMRQLAGVRIAAKFADSIFMAVGQERVLARALISIEILTELCESNIAFSIVDLVNRLNVHQLAPGFEILLANRTSNGPSTTVLSSLKRPDQCSQPGCPMSSDIQIAMERAVLRKEQGSVHGVDYAGVRSFIGFAPLECQNLGMVYLIAHETMQKSFLKQTVDAADQCNLDILATPGSTELMVVNTSNPGTPLTQLFNTSTCYGGVCGADAAAIASVRYGNTTGLNYRLQEVMVVSAEMPNLNATAVLEVAMADIKDQIISQLGAAGNLINNQLPGTSELELAKQVVLPNGTIGFSMLTTPRFTADCQPNCSTPNAIMAATVNCASDSGFMTDYRNHEVVAAHVCLPKLGVGLVYKTDDEEFVSQSIEDVAHYANEQNKEEKGSMELMVGKLVQNNAHPSQPAVQYVSNYLFQNVQDCLKTQCFDQGPSAKPMLDALNGKVGLQLADDYRGTRVMAAYQPAPFLKTGFVLKLDLDEVEIPLIKDLCILLGTAVGITIVGIFILGFSARRMLFTIEETWEKGKQAVEEQKEGFERLVSALYPKFASERLLSGDSQIVVEVPKATIFFSDICNFTALSNQLNPHELLEWIGYTFRVMDTCAEYYHVYKIKTIGDAYLAITGLPSTLDNNNPTEPTDAASSDHTFRMIQFASVVVQIFSGRYLHPDAGECLKSVAARSVLITKEQLRKQQKNRGSVGFMTSASSQKTGSVVVRSSGIGLMMSDKGSVISASKQATTANCAMRFGLALGPVIAGVLNGKCPAFDIWGKTVNLAARMEHTGRAGNVQCTEAVYNAVANDSRCLIGWHKPHTVYAKGFGNIPAYFMKTSNQLPPKELMLSLGLEPFVEMYVFEALVNGGTVPALIQAANNNRRNSTASSSNNNSARGGGGGGGYGGDNNRIPGETNLEVVEDV